VRGVIASEAEEFRNMKTAIVGVGNLLMADEGLGVKVVELLDRRGISREADLFDAGTGFLSVVTQLSSYKNLFIIDAVRGGKPPGTIYRFELDDKTLEDESVREGGALGAISVHDIGVLHALKFQAMAGRLPERIVLYGAEPYRVEFSLDISPSLEPVIDKLADRVLSEIRQDNKTRRKGNGSQYSKAGQRAI
jgi:hydrogenase maturation protease